MSDVDLAYLAGVLDSDGSFSIARRSRPKLASGYDYVVAVQLTWARSVAGDALQAGLRETYGGSLVDSVGRTASSRPTRKWIVQGRRADAVIRDVQPYLRLKAEQARLCLEATDLGRNPGRDRYQRVPDEVWQRRAELAETVRTLNRGTDEHRPVLV